ncbi:hypothetical protein GUJ93_ZPchr0009g2084 [Zizania palustris]|uniref:S1 motif domain-containing protein n=1 Tax=Zizania palustris TaxID=103762 RepID=A0A8J5RL29_ZIZPA|nr:hypothetical protein GUJ93_ZPchr0009g2084 [Zizania palustris]
MTPAVHCSVGNISLFHIGSFRPSREFQIRRFHNTERFSRAPSPSYCRLLQPQRVFHLISIYKRSSWSTSHRSRTLSAATVGTDVMVEDPNPFPSGETSDENSEAASGTAEASEQAEASTSSTPNVGRIIRKSEMPSLNDEDLVPGASFTGKVRSIKPFGVFVDIGAFTEGLVHISRVSDGFVKDISSLFTVGQEVSVRLMDADKKAGRISLTMRTGGDYVKPKTEEAPKAASGGRNATANAYKSSPRQREEAKKIDETKYARGQYLDGMVKSTTRSGSFVTLPDGDEGFLPREEEAVALFTLIGHSALEVGQQVRVKVLNVARGQVTLTMKEGEDDEDDLSSLNTELKQGWSRGTNAFELAFRKNKEISTFLDQRENTKFSEVQEAAVAAVGTGIDAEVGSEQSLGKETEKDSETSKTESVETASSVAISEDDSTADDKLVQPTASISYAEAESKEDTSSTESVATATEESASASSVATEVPAPEVSEASPQEEVEDSTSAEDKTDEPEESSVVEEVPVTASSESEDKESAAVTEEVAALSEKTAEVAVAGAEASTTTGQQ